ncbi:ComEC/Rec2 family competence protein [Desertibacillus haloalkaliphilus]|uniref:ComEC/Rec2 family competence protein n=1 Tax=Desertibacillus haloalkaliphilus TaxID=1328930 RepID=UPI001C280A3F|nr:MBL fold metallo-hydrolase [Desertibacillus haloalkaliphilus]MBU8907281.1 hypothetical protein [Desertibacillus haloalkaliphilus]
MGIRTYWGFVCFFCVLVALPIVIAADDDKVEVDLKLDADELAYTYFDLESGEATLIKAGTGETILVDTGDTNSEHELEKRLEMFNIDVIDVLLLTNGTNEYIGNTKWVLDHYNVKKVIVPELLEEVLIDRFSIDADKVEGWDVGTHEVLLPGLETDVYYLEKDRQEHMGAMVIGFTYGDLRTLYMGIADVKVEEQLANQFPLKSSILKVADFGSQEGTSQYFLDEVDPQVAILFKKRGESPSAFVLERLQETWIDIYQTYKIGTVLIKCTRNDYEILTVRTKKKELATL